MTLKRSIESLLFVAGKPLSLAAIAALASTDEAAVHAAVKELGDEYRAHSRGMQLAHQGNRVLLVSHPSSAALVRAFLKDEHEGELTRPSLETLTIIAYRGPVTKLELEQIRGVNCSLILRNLSIRGLIEVAEGDGKQETRYVVTFDFLKFLGVSSVRDLPDYEKLSQHETLEKLLHDVADKPADVIPPPAL